MSGHFVTVRVSDTADGLIINKQDAKAHNLEPDFPYEGSFLPDGRYRIRIPAPAVAPLPVEEHVLKHWFRALLRALQQEDRR